MGWSIGWDSTWQRDIGYGVPAYCDYPGCNEEINRGLGYLCDNAKGDYACCGLYFCAEHSNRCKNERDLSEDSYDCDDCEVCDNCRLEAKKQEHPEWINWKLTDKSWQQWRDENPEEVAKLREQLK